MDDLNCRSQDNGHPQSFAPRSLSSFSTLSVPLLDKKKRKMFQRMNRDSFQTLCHVFKMKVGTNVFKSKSYLHDNPTSKTAAACDANGGIISGEMKLPVFLGILAGATSYLGMILFYLVGVATVYSILDEITTWVSNSFQESTPTRWVQTSTDCQPMCNIRYFHQHEH